MRLYLLIGFVYALMSLSIIYLHYMDILYEVAEGNTLIIFLAFVVTGIISMFIYPILIVSGLMDDDVF